MKIRAIIAYFLSYTIMLQPVFAAGIEPVGSTNMGTPSGPNNVPVLNINAPTAAGVSHNKFNQFNVDEKGLIINNLNMQNYNPNYKSSITGEHVEFNYNFRTGDAAKVILNEVISNSVTALRGQTEIYGQRADYIVANPNGITCAGCGFINTGRLSLITGSANMVGGAVDSFNISGTGILKIEGVGTTNFGLYAPTHADLVSNAIRVAGEIHANGDLNIYSGNDKFDYKNKVVSSNTTPGIEVAVDSTAIGGMKANNIRIVATQRGFGINTAGNLVSDMGNVEITADGDIVVKNIAAKNDVKIESKSKSIKTGMGTQSDVYAENNITIKAAKDFKNDIDAKVIAQNNVDITANEKLINIGKINSAKTLNIEARDLHNYGQLLSGRDMTLSVGNDLINYRGAGILSGGDINASIGRDLVNYKAEIYAMGNINIQGRDDIPNTPSGLQITSANMAAMAALYDNPYVTATTTPPVNPPAITYPTDPEPEEFLDMELELSNGETVTLPADAIPEDVTPGYTYTVGGYIFIVGIESTTEVDNPAYLECFAAGTCTDEPEKIMEYSYSGTDFFTVKNKTLESDGTRTNLGYTIIEPTEAIGDGADTTLPPPEGLEDKIQPQPGTSTANTNDLDGFNNSILDGITLNNNRMGTLLNWAGRIESGKNLSIAADNLTNKGFDIYTGNGERVNKKYHRIRDKACSGLHTCGWTELGRDIITKVNLDSDAAYIISGGNMIINAKDILNQSAVLSSHGNMILNADNTIKNQTYSEIEKSNIREGRRTWGCSGLKCGFRNDTRTTTYENRVYSKQRSMIISGGDLKLKSTTLENDQVLDPLAGVGINIPLPTDVDGGVSVSTRLPVGDNGLFVVKPDSRYLVQTNVTFINPNDFLGSDYFFNSLGWGQSAIDTTRIIGDPAYETRLVMDAITKATGKHYLGNDGVIGADTDQMRALYDSALTAQKDLKLTVGIALTAAQIANLQQDIIWYVTKNVDGHEVLVPQLYLSQATLDSISGNGKGSQITGVTVLAENDYMVNVGTISANNLLMIDTKTLINESNDELAGLKSGGGLRIDANRVENNSALIAGDVVQIKADELINKTKVLSEDRNHDYGDGNYEKNHIEATSHIATISGTNGLGIELTGKLHNTGATIESEKGNINIKAKEVVFDTAVLHNRSEVQDTSNYVAVSTSELNIKESVKNIGSKINAGGGLKIKTTDDATFAGTTVNAGTTAFFDVGGNTNIVAVKDYEYSKNEKSTSIGADWLYSEKDTLENTAEHLKGASVNVTDGLTVVSGKNVNVVASDINAFGRTGEDGETTGGDIKLLAGYKVGEDNKLEKSGKNGSVNIVSADEVSTTYEKHEKTNMLEGVAKIALAGATGGASLLVGSEVSCEGGHCSISTGLGEKTKDETRTTTTKSVGSELNAAGNISIGATDNINVIGSDVGAIGDIVFDAGKNITIASSQDTKTTQSTHEETKIKGSVSVGNSYVDTAYSLADMYDAADAVTKAAEALKHMKELRDQGKATDQAVLDAEVNLTMASINAGMQTLSTANSVANSAGSTPLYGFYGSAGLNFDTTSQNSDSRQSTAVASNISSGGNTTFKAGENMYQIGSNVTSDGDITYNITKDLKISASTDTSSSSNSTKHVNVNGMIGTNGWNAGAGYDQSKSGENSTTYNNSTTTAENGKITYNVGGDMSADGYNALGKNIDLNVEGDLSLASKQDTYSSNNSSWGVNANYGENSAGGGGSFDKGNTDSKWTNSVSSIIGTESVDVDVKGNLDMKGSMIANIDEKGKDGGNLDISAGSITYTDLKDTYRDKETGFSASTSIGKNPEGTNDGRTNGSTTIGMTNKGSEKDQTTHATIGAGTITVGGTELPADDPSLAGLNRNTDKDAVQELTRDQITGALDFKVTIDHSVVDAKTWENVENLPGNLFDAAVNAGSSAAGVGKLATYDLANNIYNNWDEPTKILYQAGMEFKIGAIANQIGQNPELAREFMNAQNDPNFVAEQMSPALTEIFKANGLGFDELKVYSQLDDRKGFNVIGEDGKKVVAINVVDYGTGKTVDGKTMVGMLFYEATNDQVGNTTANKEAVSYAEYATESMGFFNSIRLGDGYGAGTDQNWIEYNQQHAGAILDAANKFVRDNPSTTTSNHPAVVGGAAAVAAGVTYHRVDHILANMLPGEDYDTAKARLEADKDWVVTYSGFVGDTMGKGVLWAAEGTDKVIQVTVGQKAAVAADVLEAFMKGSGVAGYEDVVAGLRSLGDAQPTQEMLNWIGSQSNNIYQHVLSQFPDPTDKNAIMAAKDAVETFTAMFGVTAVVAGTATNVVKAVAQGGAKTAGKTATSVANKLGDAKNAATHQNYVDDLTRQMEKPAVKDANLNKIVDDLYRDNAKVGSGSTADAVRHELKNGGTVGGKTHSQKAQNKITELNKWIKKNPGASAQDIQTANKLIRDMENALNGK